MNFFKNFTRQSKLLIVGFFTLLFFRLPSFFETFWYGDENYYLAVAQSMVKGGQWLYVGAWDNKPPILYYVYAFSVWLFGIELWPLRVFNFLLGFLVCYLVYKICLEIFNFSKKASVSAFFVSIFLQSIYFEVTIFNAENLFVPLVLLGFYLVAKNLLALNFDFNFFGISAQEMLEEIGNTKWNNFLILLKEFRLIILGGFVWSLAILTKIPALAEIGWLIALIYLVLLYKFRREWPSLNWYERIVEFLKIKRVWFSALLLVISIAFLPIVIAFVYYINGYFSELWFAVWQYNNQYYLPENSNPVLFGFTLPIKSLYFRALLLISVLALTTVSLFQRVDLKSNKEYNKLSENINQSNLGQNGFIIINWLCVATFSVLIAERNYPHYLQQILPISAILVAWLVSLWSLKNLNLSSKFTAIVASLVFYQILLTNFTGGSGVLNYFNIDQYWGKNGFNTVITGNQSLASWQRSFDANTVDKTRLLVPIVQKYTNSNDNIFIASTMPEIYPVSDRLNAYKYVVDYHPLIDLNEEGLYKLLVEKKTKLILTDSQSGLSKKLLVYLPQKYNLIEQVSGRYSIWVLK